MESLPVGSAHLEMSQGHRGGRHSSLSKINTSIMQQHNEIFYEPNDSPLWRTKFCPSKE